MACREAGWLACCKWRKTVNLVFRLTGLQPMFEHLAQQLAGLELPDTSVNEAFERIDA